MHRRAVRADAALLLDVYGVRVSLSGDDEALAALRLHFFSFVRASISGKPDVTIALRRSKVGNELPRRLRADQVVQRGVVFNDGTTTWVDHHGRAVSRFDFGTGEGCVVSESPSDLVEHGFLMIHARLGPLLERRGLVRVHAAGVVVDGRAALILTPSGGGKSRLAIAFLGHQNLQLLGDDVVLVDRRGLAYPFPSPVGTSSRALIERLGPVVEFPRWHHGTKYMLDPDSIRDRFAGKPYPVAALVRACRVSQSPSTIQPASRAALAGDLWRDAVVGLGLPQVIELVARRGVVDLWRHAPSAVRRSLTAAALFRRSRAFLLEVADPEDAAGHVVRWLRTQRLSTSP